MIKCNTLKSEMLDKILEEKMIGKSHRETQKFLGRPADIINENERTYILKTYCFGIFSKKLHLYFYEGRLRDYYIGIF
ncbi:hypothetical protein BXY58_0730 [Epilithonimonas arachidiradicis]|uniref:Uncharacterized protein n=1 Tax=Epilithonimonas arachidiradicis TaxID=1617282 RepID=A0A420DES3_9FLAO|nr:hypothetical protein BXY58_0730 [Epilithonimonas arachidiradicis]GGG48032.1 hypothetical protein GCM10007332_06940 [Epilithonimonas arachidiradicis]